MSSLNEFLDHKLSNRKTEGLLRKLKLHPGLIDFCSNDYLGLARSPLLFSAIRKKLQALDPPRNGSTGSRLLSGNSVFHEEVESRLASIFESEAALLFSSGYMANLAVLSSLPQRGDTILLDELSHACMKDGARLSMATRHSFRHNDLEDLERKLKKAAGKVFIAVESIYSMDGDQCPLDSLVTLAEKYDAHIILDEAHSTGVLGPSGNGMAASLGLSARIAVRVHTFGKAMGIHGACVAGSDKVKQFLINFARPFIYTTAPDFHSLFSIEESFRFLSENITMQAQLAGKIMLFSDHTQMLATRKKSSSPVQCIIVPGNRQAAEASMTLQQHGFDVRPILSPTVPKGQERLRICLHVFNTDDEIIRLAGTLNSLAAVR